MTCYSSWATATPGRYTILGIAVLPRLNNLTTAMCAVHRRSDRTFTQPFHTVTPGANLATQIWVKYRGSASLLLSSPDLVMFSTEVMWNGEDIGEYFLHYLTKTSIIILSIFFQVFHNIHVKTLSFTFTVLITKLFLQWFVFLMSLDPYLTLVFLYNIIQDINAQQCLLSGLYGCQSVHSLSR